MTYKAKEWINSVYDDEGNILRKGTPLMAEAMNKIETELEKLSENQPLIAENSTNHENRITINEETISTLDSRLSGTEDNLIEIELSKSSPGGIATLDENGIVPSTQLPSNLKEIKVVPTLIGRDNLEKFEGLRVMVLDASSDPTVNSGWAEYVWSGTEFIKVAEAEGIDLVIKWADVENKPTEYNPKKHTHSESELVDLDKYTKQEVDIKLNGKSGTGHKHTESEITDLDKYTKTEVDTLLTVVQETIDNHVPLMNNPHGVTKAHIGLSSVPNAGYSTQAQAVAGTVATTFMTPLRTKQAIDALQAIKSVNGQVGDILIDTFSGDYNSLTSRPSIPSKLSDLTDDSQFVKSNASKITVSTTAPVNPSINDIWIVV